MTSATDGLRGRRPESAHLDRLVADVRAGQGRVLIVRGEAGIGKSVLLDHLAGHADGCRVARASGVESEMELPFAGLHQLCAPMLDLTENLPPPQRAALAVAFGLEFGGPPDRFLVGAAVLSLLSEVADRQPLLCVVDDAQWLDQASAQALTFVGRRLFADKIGVVFGVRDPVTGPEWRGFPELVVGGLPDEEAGALLDAVVPGRLDEHVRDRIVAETRGNPLALLELPRGLSAAELAGGFERPDARPLASQIEQNFVQRVQLLPPETQRLLLTAAAEPVGDVPLLLRALRILELPGERGRTRRRGRPGRTRCACPVPASAGAVGGVPGGCPGRPPCGAPGHRRGDRPGHRSGPPRLAPGSSRRRTGRGGGRRADRVRRAGPTPRRRRRHGSVPAARDRADPGPGDAREPRPRRGPGHPPRGRVRKGTETARDRRRVVGGRAAPGHRESLPGTDHVCLRSWRSGRPTTPGRRPPARAAPRRTCPRHLPRRVHGGDVRGGSRPRFPTARGGAGRPRRAAAHGTT